MRDVRRANRYSLLSDLFHGGPQTRPQLAATTQLSQASVSNLIGEMLTEGLVEEAGLVDSDGGRPRVLLQVRPDFGFVVGADVTEDRILVELYDLTLTRRAALRLKHDNDPQQVARHLLAGLAAVIAEAGVDPTDVLGFGVGVPGFVDRQGVVDSQVTGWDAVPLGEMLRAGCGVQVLVANGADAFGQAEMWFGSGRGAGDAVIVLVGAGVDAAVMVDGRPLRWATGHPGEWAHTTLVYNGEPCRCGGSGCVEAYIGAGGMGRRLAAATGRPYGPELLAEMLAADSVPPAAISVFKQAAGHLGASIANLINLFGPERVVLGGATGAEFGRQFLPEIRAAAARHALGRPFAKTDIRLCELGADAVALGAATLPVAWLLAAGGAGEPAESTRSAVRR